MIKIKKYEIVVILAYVALTIIFTYPVAFSEDKIPGDGGDGYQHLWYLWWFKTSLLNFSDPYHTTYIYYPNGANLAFNAMHPSNSILSIPFQLIFGLIWSYKIIWLISFVIAGLGTYLLVTYLTNNRTAAFIVGLIFMFSPYHFARGLGHLNLMAIGWMPFYILYLFKTIDEDKLKNSIYAAIFLTLNSTEYYYFIYMSFFTVIFLIYCFLTNKNNLLKKNTIKRISTMVIIFGLMYIPFVYPLLKELITSESNYMYYGGFVEYSADLLGFFIPAPFHPIFGKYVIPIYKNFTGEVEVGTIFVGYTVMFLVIISILKVKTKEIRFWLSIAIMSFLFALGPILHINGKLFDIIRLPYSILMHIPVISIARAPTRWDVLLMLSLAVISGYGLKYILSKNKISKAIILSSLILFEYLAIPYPMSDTKIPEYYYQLRNDSGDNAIFEIPNTPIYGGIYMYYQTFHEKKIVGGYVSRLPPASTAFIRSVPLIGQLSDSKDMRINNNTLDYGKSILNYYKIRHIVLHEKYMNKDKFDMTDKLLQNISKERKIYKDDQLIVYTIKEDSKPFILFKDNWLDFEIWEGNLTPWMLNNATILGYSPEIRYINLSLETRSFYKPRLLEIYFNDKLVYQEFVSDRIQKINLYYRFKKGENIIRFYTPDICQRPIDIPELKNNDTRCLNMVFQNIIIE